MRSSRWFLTTVGLMATGLVLLVLATAQPPVSSVRADGSSPTVTPPPVFIPPAPTLISPAQGATVSSTITLRWSASFGATYYLVDITDMTAGIDLGTTKVATTSWTPYPNVRLRSGHVYVWTVQACYSGECSSASSSAFNVR
ncbi:MAG TPA: hypothetical protein VKV26_09255 [Dehalococcoidia bacterium]|nr:hypothetical protein [Dehalococcoidia bacterium]